ncbi:hypothetical protein WJX77_009760 [Trebouxia sp. C0004]
MQAVLQRQRQKVPELTTEATDQGFPYFFKTYAALERVEDQITSIHRSWLLWICVGTRRRLQDAHHVLPDELVGLQQLVETLLNPLDVLRTQPLIRDIDNVDPKGQTPEKKMVFCDIEPSFRGVNALSVNETVRRLRNLSPGEKLSLYILIFGNPALIREFRVTA